MEKHKQILIKKDLNLKALSLSLKGNWSLDDSVVLDPFMRDLEQETYSNITIDCAAISYLDTAGAWLITRFIYTQKKKGAQISLKAVNKNWRPLLQDVSNTLALEENPKPPASIAFWNRFFSSIGVFFIDLLKDINCGLYILGLAIKQLPKKLLKGDEINFASIVVQIQKIGFNAVAIIATMGFIVGAIISQQGAFQLRKFGAEIFVVDMNAILVLREMGVLITAILIAGRSGSSITAEIGAMKMREEIDALKVMGLDPMIILVFPRIIALMIAIPLLTIIANFFALMGASFICNLYSHISYALFFERVASDINYVSYFLGLLKAPFLAMIIGFIACIEGFKVKGSAESLGQHVTSAVVKTLFAVIVVDALFAILYVFLGY